MSALRSLAAAAPDVSELQGSAGVFAVILLEIAVGALALLWLTPVWGVVKRGFFVLIASTVAVCSLLALLSARSGLSRSGDRASSARLALILFAIVSAAFLAALIAKRVAAGRALGLVALALGIWAIVAIALLRGTGGTAAKGIIAMLCGAAFLGATWNGMILGHWYLVDRKLKVDPMKAASLLFSISVGLGIVSALVGRGERPTSESAFQTSALLLVSDLELYLAIGLVAVCALLAFFTHKLVHEGSIRAATGMLYLAVIMAFSAEFAAKVYFFSV
ncbi:MAG: hypothetical protein ABIM89_16340 [Mycobacteriales bacterium]